MARARASKSARRKADRFLPELYVVPASAAVKAEVLAAVEAKIKALQAEYPGVGVEDRGTEITITVPDALRVGHEAHFAQVAASFLKYVRDRERAAGLGAPEHAGEVLRDDDRRPS